MAKLSGGGIQGNKNVKVGVSTGKAATALNPSYPSQIGSQFGNHADRGDTPKTAQVKPSVGTAPSVKLGNEKALDVGGGGPGTGRTTYNPARKARMVPPLPARPRLLATFFPSSDLRSRRPDASPS